MSSVATTPVIRPAWLASDPAALRAGIESSLTERLASTLLLRERSAPVTVSTGIAALDVLTGGVPRGALSEVTGAASSGRTGVMQATLAEATRRQEICALVDGSDSFDPVSAVAAGIDLQRLLWVRCSEDMRSDKASGRSVQTGFAFHHTLEQVLKVTDLLLHAGGFGMVVLDLGDIPAASVRRIPLTSWFRFRRAVEPTATALLLVEQEPCAKTCASLVVRLQPISICTSDAERRSHKRDDNIANVVNMRSECEQMPYIPKSNVVSHADLFQGMRFRAEVVRSWQQRKSPQPVKSEFELRAAR